METDLAEIKRHGLGTINTNFRSQLVILHGNLTTQRYTDVVLQSVLAPLTAAQTRQHELIFILFSRTMRAHTQWD